MCTKITDINNSQLPHYLEKESQEATTSKAFVVNLIQLSYFPQTSIACYHESMDGQILPNIWSFVCINTCLGLFCCVRRTIRHPYCFIIVYYIDHPNLVIWMDFFFILFPTLASYVCKCFHYFSFVDRTIGGDLFQPVKNRILLVT